MNSTQTSLDLFKCAVGEKVSEPFFAVLESARTIGLLESFRLASVDQESDGGKLDCLVKLTVRRGPSVIFSMSNLAMDESSGKLASSTVLRLSPASLCCRAPITSLGDDRETSLCSTCYRSQTYKGNFGLRLDRTGDGGAKGLYLDRESLDSYFETYCNSLDAIVVAQAFATLLLDLHRTFGGSEETEEDPALWLYDDDLPF